MKIRAMALALILVLTGCAKTTVATDINAVTYSSPKNCELESLIAAFDTLVPGSKYVPTQWQPAKDTDLYDAYAADGIACSYGIQSAEIGGTIMWAKISEQTWESKKVAWLENNQIVIDIPGVNESSATSLKLGSTGADNKPTWAVNLYVNDVWIQVVASFIQSLDQAMPIIEAAIESLEKSETQG